MGWLWYSTRSALLPLSHPFPVIGDTWPQFRSSTIDLIHSQHPSPSSSSFSPIPFPSFNTKKVLMRPEDGYGPSVDWWGVGVIAAELLAGMNPLKGKGRTNTMQRIVQADETLLPFFRACDRSGLSDGATSLIRGLLCTTVRVRLACGRHGWLEMRTHPFFEGLDWEGVLRGDVANIRPILSGPGDTRYFAKDRKSSPAEERKEAEQAALAVRMGTRPRTSSQKGRAMLNTLLEERGVTHTAGPAHQDYVRGFSFCAESLLPKE